MIVSADISSLSELPRRVHLAMGVFDGVHKGHQEVIKKAVAEAKKNGELSGVLTFDPFPMQVLMPDRAPQRILATIKHKIQLLSDLGVEYLLVIPFDKDFARCTAKEFLDLISDSGKLAHISIGEDWKFGKGREGRLEFLKSYCQERQIALSAIAPIIHNQERISSTRIRQCVRDGNLRSAAEMLGRAYSLFGKVVKGDQLGTEIGFPTANIDTQNELLPPNGVYAVKSEHEGRLLTGVANLGVRPTVSGENRRCFEVHFFDFSDDLYDLELEVEIGMHIREEQKFSGLGELKSQIAKDCQSGQDLILAGNAWYV